MTRMFRCLALALGLAAAAAPAAAVTFNWTHDGQTRTGRVDLGRLATTGPSARQINVFATGAMEFTFFVMPKRQFIFFGHGATDDLSGFSLTLERYEATGLLGSITWTARSCLRRPNGTVIKTAERFDCPGVELRPHFIRSSAPLLTISGATRIFTDGNGYPTRTGFYNTGGIYRLFVTPTSPTSSGQVQADFRVTPLPASAWLLGSVLGAGLWLGRRRKSA